MQRLAEWTAHELEVWCAAFSRAEVSGRMPPWMLSTSFGTIFSGPIR